MKHYYLKDLTNPNLWKISEFDCALTIIKIFLFIIFKYFYFFFSCFALIEGHNENKAICLFCVMLTIPDVQLGREEGGSGWGGRELSNTVF